MQDQLMQQVAADLGITGFSKEEQEELISQFGEVALKAASVAVLEKLDDAKRVEFAKLAEAGDAAAVQTFLDREVPGHEALAKAAVEDEVRKFKEFQAGAK